MTHNTLFAKAITDITPFQPRTAEKPAIAGKGTVQLYRLSNDGCFMPIATCVNVMSVFNDPIPEGAFVTVSQALGSWLVMQHMYLTKE